MSVYNWCLKKAKTKKKKKGKIIIYILLFLQQKFSHLSFPLFPVNTLSVTFYFFNFLLYQNINKQTRFFVETNWSYFWSSALINSVPLIERLSERLQYWRCKKQQKIKKTNFKNASFSSKTSKCFTNRNVGNWWIQSHIHTDDVTKLIFMCDIHFLPIRPPPPPLFFFAHTKNRFTGA